MFVHNRQKTYDWRKIKWSLALGLCGSLYRTITNFHFCCFKAKADIRLWNWVQFCLFNVMLCKCEFIRHCKRNSRSSRGCPQRVCVRVCVCVCVTDQWAVCVWGRGISSWWPWSSVCVCVTDQWAVCVWGRGISSWWPWWSRSSYRLSQTQSSHTTKTNS